MEREELEPGTRLRWLRGRHPGGTIKVVSVGVGTIEFTVPRAKTGRASDDRGRRHQTRLDFVLRNAEVVR